MDDWPYSQLNGHGTRAGQETVVVIKNSMNRSYWMWAFVWLLSGCLGVSDSKTGPMASGGQTAISATTPGTGGGRNSGDTASVTASGGMAIMGGVMAMQENPEPEPQSRPEDKITIETLVDDRIVPINDGVGLLAFEVPENTFIRNTPRLRPTRHMVWHRSVDGSHWN